jgi:hypothetical protein
MKYSHRSDYRKTCPHDPQTRAQLGSRLRYARLKLGWSIEAAGKYFQVTDRTWHNWETGAHRIPFAVYKLCRVLARLALPGAAWAGWRLEGSALITPEGRQITPQDGSWWSLLVRRAAGFDAAYKEASRLRGLLMQVKSTAQDTASASGEAAALPGPDAVGLVPYKTSPHRVASGSSQNDVIMTSWPIPSDSQTPLTHLHAPRRTTSASASTPSFVLPWTPTCEVRVNLLRSEQIERRSPKWCTGKTLSPKRGIQGQSLNKSSPANSVKSSPDSNGSPENASARATAPQGAEPSTPKHPGGAL